MRLYFLNFILLLGGSLQAQNYIDLVRFDYNHTAPQPFDTVGEPKGQFQEMTLDFTLPFKINDNLALLTGLNFETLYLDTSPSRLDQQFYGLSLKLGANIQHSNKWSATYLLLPKISSDLIGNRSLFSNIGSDIGHAHKKDFQIGGAVIFKYAKNEMDNYRLGLYYNSELFGPMFIPFLGLYRLHGRVETNLMLPLTGEVGYFFSDNLKGGFKFLGSNKTYNLTDRGEYLVKLNNEIGPYFQYAAGAFNIQLHTGITFLRSFRTYQEGDRVKYAISIIKPGDDRQQLNPDLGNGFFLKTSLIYRFDLSSNTE